MTRESHTLDHAHGDASARRALSVTWAALAALLVVAPAPAQVVLPDMGDSSQAVLTPANARDIGDAFMRNMRANVPLVEDPEVTSYIQSLGDRLASYTGPGNPRFTFFIVDVPVINAFAVPGGFIAVNAGLITTTQSESELAAVMAHEISHITQKHIARMFELQSQSMLPTLGAMIAALAVGIANPQAGVATAAAVQGRAAQKRIDFTRANEKEADRVGIQLLAKAGLDPRAMPNFFERLQEATRFSSHPPPFLNDHPVTTARIAESQERAEKFPYRQHTDSIAFHLVRAKLQVHAAHNPDEAVSQFKELLDSGKYTSLIGATYGYALALVGAQRMDEAREVVDLLIKRLPDIVSFHVLLARVELGLGNPHKALRVLEDNLQIYPANRMLIRGYVDTLIRVGRPADALAALDRYERHDRLDTVMYRLAALAYDRVGNQRSAHASLAEHYYLNGQLRQATRQLKLAMNAPSSGDYYADAKIQARLHQLQDEQIRRKKR